MRSRIALLALIAFLALAAAGNRRRRDERHSGTVVLVTHDSFAIPKQVKAAFEQESGFKLRILQGGDAGETVNRALLTKGNPQGDVLFGIDNNLLSRALDENLFDSYEATGLDKVDPRFVIDPKHRVTPVDHGDVCLNTDKKWFASHGVAPPRTLADLTAPRYRKLLVVENPATSTPGLAFLLATVARFGENGWQDYWRKLRANGVLVTDGWEEAYNTRFSGAGGGKGDRPIVVSYATDPAAEVMFAKTKPTTAPTAVMAASCFRQIEFAGVLDGAKNAPRSQGADRLHAREAVPGGGAREHVRAAGPNRHAASGCIPPLRRLAGLAAQPAGCDDRPQPRPLDRRVDTDRSALRRGWRIATVAVPVAFLALFFAFPLAAILERGLTSAGGPTLPAGTVGLLWFTIWQAAASTALTLAAGLPACVGDRTVQVPRTFARSGARARAVRAADGRRRDGFLSLLPAGHERGIWAILAAHAFFNIAVVTRIVGGAWATIGPVAPRLPRFSGPARGAGYAR